MADVNEEGDVTSTIIMKVDAPPDDNNLTSQGTSAHQNNFESVNSTRTFSKQKKSYATSGKSNSNNPFALRSYNNLNNSKTGSGIVFRPSQLGTKLENKTETTKNQFSLNPSRLNPFAKNDMSKEQQCNSPNPFSLNPSRLNPIGRTDDEKLHYTSSSSSLMDASPLHQEQKNSPEIVSTTNNGTAYQETPKFVPLVVSDASTRSGSASIATAPVTQTPNFVFGQNLHARVISESESGNESATEPMPSTSCTNANGTSELLFSSAVKNTVAATSEINKEVKSLTESAREYEESRANKRKYEEVTIVTGEEDEKNILQINCKLFAFDKATGNWQERGRGTLRLNDKEVTIDATTYFQSRLVIRTAGSLRVVLNTKIWAGMTIDRASPKSLRLTAMDASAQVRVFLIMASPDEITQIHRLLEHRVENEIERQQLQKSCNGEPDVKKRTTCV